MCPSIKILVREHPKLGVYVEGLTELVVTSSNEINKRMVEGKNRDNRR